MRERKKALERLLAVQIQLRRLEEARFAEIEKQRVRARDERWAMFGFLEESAQKDPLLLHLACGHIVAAERGMAALDAQADAQRKILAHRHAQERGAEKMLRQAAAALERAEEKRVLIEIAERLGAVPPSACRKP